MALDNGFQFAAQGLPTPTDKSSDSPPTNIPKQPSCQGTSSRFSNCAPVPLPPSEESYYPKHRGRIEDGQIERPPVHESRRFTPNDLGVSLIAQIHSLKKELGSKDTLMESLEESLQITKAENEQLTNDLKTKKNEVTSVKKQMQSLENDMLRALEDVAKEKENAVESLADTWKHLENSKKKSRAQEEDVNRAHAIWEKEREDWNDERRKMESRIHTVEERLKTMVAEMLIVQNTSLSQPEVGNDSIDENAQTTWSGNSNDNSSIHATSRLSNRSLEEHYDGKRVSNFRSSRISGLHGFGGSQMSGLSLAAELEFGDDGTDVRAQDNDPITLPKETYISTRRYPEEGKANDLAGFSVDQNEETIGDDTSGQHSMGIIDDYIDIPENQLGSHYTDVGTQFTPPSSPTLQTQEAGLSEKQIEQVEPTANQSRKRIAIPQIFAERTPAPNAIEPKIVAPKALSMISTGSQTVGQPEDLDLAAQVALVTSISVPALATEMKSASTQTTEDASPVPKSATFRLLPSKTDVPVIAIHPPASRPSSSRNSVTLPPRTQNAACQVAIEFPRTTKSTSMQTKETEIGEQNVSVLLRAPFRPPSVDISTQPPTRLAEGRKQAEKATVPEFSRNKFRSLVSVGATEQRPSAAEGLIKNPYCGNNDNGPLTHRQPSGPRRPIRSGSILAGFDLSSEDDPENPQDNFSDDEFLNAAPIRKTLSKVQNSWRLVPHVEDSVLERLESASKRAEDERHVRVPKAAIADSKASSKTASKTHQIQPAESFRNTSSVVKQPDIRRKALVINGVVEHAQRDRSPSKSSIWNREPTVAPPFPVPARSSSRNITLSASDRAASPDTTTLCGAGQGQNSRTPKRQTLRKVQSAAAVAQPQIPSRLQSLSASSTVPPSPKCPAPRRNQFLLPYESVVELQSHSAPSQIRTGESSIENHNEHTSVVDAIAQTMVGEWMWKYVRKRTSFGITESPQGEFDIGRNGETGNCNGVRHKRWVWLAPYERSVIWSSKQPTSGPTLLGKGGRKLAIQSVIDVKDDTPPPKSAGSQAIFDRSILILTPQRALKFTATSQERHYIWLTALSFLSHSARGMDDLASPPPLPKQEHQHSPSPSFMTGFRRMPIRGPASVGNGYRRPSIGSHSYSPPIGSIEQEIIEGLDMRWEDEEVDPDGAAEPPQVYRLAVHARKGSSTGPRPVPLSAFHCYPKSRMAMASSSCLRGATSREKYGEFPPHVQVGGKSSYGSLSRHITQSSIAFSPVVADNSFDTVGTVRMEAFVDRMEQDFIPSTTGKTYFTRQGRRKDRGEWGLDAWASNSALDSVRPHGEDPFTGF